MTSIRIAAAAFAAALIAGTSAHASSDDVTFRFNRGELSTEAGAKLVYKRMESAAERQCRSGGRASLPQRRMEKACAKDLLAQYVQAAGSARLSAIHDRAAGGARVASYE